MSVGECFVFSKLTIYGDNYGTTQTNNVYKVDDLGRYYMFA